MKVLYFHQHFSTPQGATGTRSYEMARRLVECGHQVTMVCGSGFMARSGLDGKPVKGIRRGIVNGVEVIEICLPYSNYDSLMKRALIFLRFALKSIMIAWQTDYDILFATSTPLTAGIPGILMRVLKPGKKFVFEVRDLWPELPKAMGVVKSPVVLFGMTFLEWFSYLSMHAGVALSPGIRKGMLRGAGAGKEVAMIPNGCDVDMFRPGDKGTSEYSLPAGVPDSGLRCVFTGAHGIANGLDAVLDAANILKQKGRLDIHLIFIGDGKLKPRLQQRAQDEKLANCIFVDPMPKTQLAGMLGKMDVGLMILDNVPAFYWGTSPNKFFDYISTGLPVLNNYPGWLADIITENDCGVAVPPGNPDVFAEALIELADNPGKLKRMSQNSRKLAVKEFPRDKLADRFVAFLSKIYKQ